ncbi:glycosyltransferase 87 family protein [Streptomyces sp. H10-C2]|uniref:glycosyltransferase 87 family protein n=1 Tax=unclassified Streptomyces TaxID=2593676 RepID=UPI0024B9CAF1|nr:MULTISPECIES: glycosyltransferase 87 family protein [unclassified Streptomyces]MDJ0341133.1 glycosyltransferase 87 family protein [Streptomyces sp. PH10-H1]MDJ0369515.1 glycosyltransferase 87 family protein [Streptomyces sp. H10-C2]
MSTARVSRSRNRAVLAWAATRCALLLCVFHVVTLPGPDVTVDVSVIYQGWYEVLSTGTFPLDDVTWQYPPAAALVVLSPALLPFLGYAAAFFWLVCAADAAVFAALLRAGRGAGRRLTGAWVWVAGVALLGPTAYARYDLVVTAVAVASMLALARRPRAAGALAGLGAMLKVWPLLLLIGAPPGRATRRAAAAAGSAAAFAALLFVATMPGAFAFLIFQRRRGTEVESLGALPFHLARHFGWRGQVLLNFGSVEFLGPFVGLAGALALALTAAAFCWLLLWRLRARHFTAATPYDAAFAAVLVFTVTSRVISPQYLVWLVGTAALCMTLRASVQRVPAALVLIATGLTLLEFPLLFSHVVASDWLGVGLLVLRDGMLAVASVTACRRLWTSSVRGPEGLPRQRAAGTRAPALTSR